VVFHADLDQKIGDSGESGFHNAIIPCWLGDMEFMEIMEFVESGRSPKTEPEMSDLYADPCSENRRFNEIQIP